MKCTNKTQKFYRKKRRNRKRELTLRLIGNAVIITAIIVTCIYMMNSKHLVATYESKAYHSIYETELFTKDLCVTNEEVEFEEFHTYDEFHGALLFNIKNQDVIYSERAHERLYPASTTKILTAYMALKYGNMDDTVTVSKTAVAVPSDSSTAKLQAGDVLTLRDLLYGLMLPSGNDCAVAIAEHLSGDVETFMDAMNQEALSLGATNTHFVNPHGYQHKDHYTTAYDLYLIFNQCIKNETFRKIVSSRTYTVVISNVNGGARTLTWNQSNQFINGAREIPRNIRIVGGKTGNTYDAGSCILLYGSDAKENEFITVMMGATSRRNLYDNMTFLLAAYDDVYE